MEIIRTAMLAIEVKAEAAEDTFKFDPDTGEVSDIYAGTPFEDKK